MQIISRRNLGGTGYVVLMSSENEEIVGFS